MPWFFLSLIVQGSTGFCCKGNRDEQEGLALACLLSVIIGNIFCLLSTDDVCRIPSSNIGVSTLRKQPLGYTGRPILPKSTEQAGNPLREVPCAALLLWATNYYWAWCSHPRRFCPEAEPCTIPWFLRTSASSCKAGTVQENLHDLDRWNQHLRVSSPRSLPNPSYQPSQ